MGASSGFFLQEKAQDIHTRLKRTAEDIIAIGQDLIEVKARLQHGQFLPWLQTEFEMTRQTAANFMRVAERFSGEKCKTILHLPAPFKVRNCGTPIGTYQLVISHLSS